jgi:hypothetical protein
MADLLDSMLDLLRRLPPTQIEENVSLLVRLAPPYADDLLGSVDQPLKARTDAATGREYLACDYNRDGESYRCALLTCVCVRCAETRAARRGQTSTIRRSRTARRRRRSYASSRSR